MLAIRDLSQKELAALYEQTAELVDTVSQFIPTTNITGLVHHGTKLMEVIEARLAIVDPLPVPVRTRRPRKTQTVEVK